MVSKELFKELGNSSRWSYEGEDLNRVSGDIEMVDKYVPPAFY